ncbi:MAG: hypothetical protein PHE55_22495 [Methylococcaceae bacterium]|nr:hypothetical protein [Methylococcaceae bacterium]
MASATESSTLYDTLRVWLKSVPWRDARHLQTLAWMMVGLLSSNHVALTRWTSFGIGRAEFAQSTQRRFERWLSNRRISVLHLYGALLRQVLADFKDRRGYLALDTTMLWDIYCVVYLSLVYRGRMIPLVWKVMKQGSASVAFHDDRSLLVFLKRHLAPYEMYLLADRGFVHRELMGWVKQTPRWHFRIRYKSGIGLYRWDGGKFIPLPWHVDPGRVVCYHGVYVTAGHEKVHLAVGRQMGAEEPWIILSDEPTSPETLYEYGLRFNIEEGFLDQKSNGFRWESSKLRDRHALQRLYFVMVVTTLALICQGSAVVVEGQCRVVDPHGFRGHSYARIGWDWIRHALARGKALLPHHSNSD